MSGADNLGYPFSFLKGVVVTSAGERVSCGKEPFVATVPLPKKGGGAGKEGGVVVQVGFHAHYGEPALTLPVNLDCEQPPSEY